MGDWPLFGNMGAMAWISQDSTHPYSVQLTANSSANTKATSWTQWSASTPFAANMIMIMPQVMDSSNILLDIAIGAPGSEIIILNNLLISGGAPSTNFVAPSFILIPVYIPAGVRVSARIQSSTGSRAVRFACHILSGNFKGLSPLNNIITYGANTGTSGGTSIDPGATAEIKGAWVQLTASSAQLQGLFCAIGNQIQIARSWSTWCLDIGIGGAGSEKVILPDLPLFSISGIAQMAPIFSPFFPISIPAGSRIAARASCYINTATVRLFDLVLYGLN
jgi:hypothetical protein